MPDKSPFVSIVTNLYKSKKFLPKLIKSVADQSFTDWELICVDDCSPTDDGAEAKRLALKYGIADKVNVVRNKTNLGLSQAKERGIKEARGKYITFIDGDDWLEPDALMHLATPAIKYDVDYVNMNSYRVHPLFGKNKNFSGLPPEDSNRVLLGDEFFDKCFVNFLGPAFFPYAYWSKLYRTEIVKNINFEFPDREHVMGEDRWFNIEVFQHLKSGYFSDYYGYNWRAGGLTDMRTSSIWSYCKLLEDEHRHYQSNKALIQKYNYHKADIPLVCFLDYCFKSAAIELFRNGHKKDEILNFIQDSISLECYQDFKLLLDYPPFEFDYPLIESVVRRDVQAVYDNLYQLHRKSWRGRLLHKFEDLILKPLGI